MVIWKSFSSISTSIVFEELPCVNRFLRLCLLWETGELELEKDLYDSTVNMIMRT